MRRYDIAVQWLHYLLQVRIYLGPQSPRLPPSPVANRSVLILIFSSFPSPFFFSLVLFFPPPSTHPHDHPPTPSMSVAAATKKQVVCATDLDTEFDCLTSLSYGLVPKTMSKCPPQTYDERMSSGRAEWRAYRREYSERRQTWRKCAITLPYTRSWKIFLSGIGGIGEGLWARITGRLRAKFQSRKDMPRFDTKSQYLSSARQRSRNHDGFKTNTVLPLLINKGAGGHMV